MKESLEEITGLIEKKSDPSTAYVDITIDEDEHPVIYGNVEGLRLLAAELLRRSNEIEEGYLVTADIPDAKWILEDHLPLSVIGIRSGRKEITETKEYTKAGDRRSRSFKDWGCFIALMLILVLIVLGIVFLVKLV